MKKPDIYGSLWGRGPASTHKGIPHEDFARVFYPQRVIDGDSIKGTLDLGWDDHKINEVIRLAGVDTPELFGPNRDTARAVKAKYFVESWLRGINGTAVEDDFTRPYLPVIAHSIKFEREKYGRALCYVYRPGDPIHLSQALIDAGHVK